MILVTMGSESRSSPGIDSVLKEGTGCPGDPTVEKGPGGARVGRQTAVPSKAFAIRINHNVDSQACQSIQTTRSRPGPRHPELATTVRYRYR